MDSDPACTERLYPDQVNIRPDPKSYGEEDDEGEEKNENENEGLEKLSRL